MEACEHVDHKAYPNPSLLLASLSTVHSRGDGAGDIFNL